MKQKYNEYDLRMLVLESNSLSELLERLNVGRGARRHIKSLLLDWKIDHSHFAKRINKGRPQNSKNRKWSDILVLKKYGKREKAVYLRKAMIQSGIEYKCSICNNIGIWLDKILRLDINHKDENPLNNLKENLEFLCPNCHRQYHTKN